MTILASFLTLSIVTSVMVWLILPRLTDAERAEEDAEFVRQYCKRKGQ